MRPCIFKGAAVAIVTPFKRDAKQSIDYEKLRVLIDRQLAAGTQAIVIAGTTGEASTMPDAEHVELIAEAVRLVGGRAPLIAGVGSNDSAHAVKLAREAERVGADALLCVTPYYNRATQEGLFRHFALTAEAVRLPIILYNVPSRTATNIAPQTYARLCAYENIVATKECNFNQLAETIALCGENMDYYTGEDGLTLPFMVMGGKGVISVASNVVPAWVAELCAQFFAGDIPAAAAIQVKLDKLIKGLFSEVNPIPVKAALNFMGMDVGECRLPLCEMSPGPAERLRQTLAEYALL